MKTLFSFHAVGDTQKSLKDTGKEIKWIAAISFSIIFFLLLFCLYAEKVNEDLSNSMIRLHIIANSDNAYDQKLKLQVRDAIIDYMNEKMDEIGTKEEAKGFLSGNKDEMEAIANEVLIAEGIADSAMVSFGKYPFPTKTYGNMILPAGYYDALKIEIGEAKGQNWWCVMFPPLCFVEDTKGVIEEEYVDLLRDELTEEEMEIISLTGSDSEIPVELKFKIVEIFQESKIKLANLFRGILSFK